MRPSSMWVDVEAWGESQRSEGIEQSLLHSVLLLGTVQLRSDWEADWVVSEHAGLGVPSGYGFPRPRQCSARCGHCTLAVRPVLSVSGWVCFCLLWFWVEVQRVGSGGKQSVVLNLLHPLPLWGLGMNCFTFSDPSSPLQSGHRASPVVLVVKRPTRANAGDGRDASSIPGVGRSLEEAR